ncbi:hypothetical protein MRX96_007998 [Rhipicephalus microplus]
MVLNGRSVREQRSSPSLSVLKECCAELGDLMAQVSCDCLAQELVLLKLHCQILMMDRWRSRSRCSPTTMAESRRGLAFCFEKRARSARGTCPHAQ